MESKVTVTGIVANPDTKDAELVVEIAINCDVCGPGMIRIPGHHLRVVRDMAMEYCDRYPELTKATVTLVNSTEFRTERPARPEDN